MRSTLPDTDSAPGTPLTRRFTSLSTYNQKLVINLLSLVALSVVIAVLSPRFVSFVNFTNILRAVAPVVIAGSAFTLLMVSRNLDLSIGSVLALSGSVAALVAGPLPVPLAFAVGIGAGTLVGALNAVLTVGFKLNSVIATIGTLYVARGSAQLLTGGLAVYDVPESYQNLGTGSFLGLANPVWIVAVSVAVFAFIERFTLLGRYTTAVGSNDEAALLSGIPLRRVYATLYVLTGTMAGLAGVMLSSRLRSGQVNLGVGFEFEVIVATLLGGTSLRGGEGSVVGMVIGALIVGVLANGLNLLGVPAFWQPVVLGTVLVLAVGLDIALRSSRTARTRRREASGVPSPEGV